MSLLYPNWRERMLTAQEGDILLGRFESMFDERAGFPLEYISVGVINNCVMNATYYMKEEHYTCIFNTVYHKLNEHELPFINLVVKAMETLEKHNVHSPHYSNRKDSEVKNYLNLKGTQNNGTVA